MLTVSLVYAFVTCFYIGFMIAIFSAIYFLYYAVASHKEGLSRLFIGRGVLFTGVALVSAMISCYMLIPEIFLVKTFEPLLHPVYSYYHICIFIVYLFRRIVYILQNECKDTFFSGKTYIFIRK